jgi:Zn-dependent membrane protease YugP
MKLITIWRFMVMGLGYFYFDNYYLMLVVPAMLFAFYAQFRVRSTFGKYSRAYNRRGLTGADVARQILNTNDLYDVRVERTAGTLSDHFDPREQVIRLSESVHSSRSIAALGVAAHETGHALQHRDRYMPIVLRSKLVPVANIGSGFGPYLAIIGLVMGIDILIELGIILFTAAVAFYLITLPVEFNASSRALAILETGGLLERDELEPAKKMLRAAALTYVASAAVAMASLLRLILLSRDRKR